MVNVEKAVRNGTSLEVYFLNGRTGLGKVKDFTAGAEHKRREKIFNKKADFEKSTKVSLLLMSASSISPRCSDSSSPSREVYGPFLAWLPEDERQILQESEGRKRKSQKAEVAWRERHGYSIQNKSVNLALHRPRRQA